MTTPEPYEPAESASRNPNLTRTIWTSVAIVAALAIGVGGGVFIGQATTSTAATSSTGFTPGSGFPGGAGGAGGRHGNFGGLTTGTIVSISGDSLLVKKADGSEVTITATGTTTVTSTTASSLASLSAGQQIRAVGQPDSSGNVTATSISEGETTGFAGPGNAAPSN